MTSLLSRYLTGSFTLLLGALLFGSLVAAPPAWAQTGSSDTDTSQPSASALLNHAAEGNVEAVRQVLASGVPADATGEDGTTALMQAAEHGHYDIAELLLQAGADPNATNDAGDTPVDLAFVNSHERVETLLVENGGDPVAARQMPDDPEHSAPDDDNRNEVFVVVEEQPDCGGVAALQKNLEYPTFAKENGIEGRVFVQFIVDENGNVTSTRVTRGVHKVLNRAAVNAVRKLECTPGRQQGEPVKVRMSLPVTFRL